jgi:hypothetical protein
MPVQVLVHEVKSPQTKQQLITRRARLSVLSPAGNGRIFDQYPGLAVPTERVPVECYT